MAWRYFATRLHGDGTETLLASDLPISDGEHTQRLTGINSLSGKVAPEITRLQTKNGSPILVPHSSCVWAEDEAGLIVGGGILVEPVVQGATLELDCEGFAGYPTGMPYIGEWSKVGVDPVAVVREVWAHLQGMPGGNLGLAVDTSTPSPVRLGKVGIAGYTEAQISGKWVPVSSLPAGTVQPSATSTLGAAMTASQTTLTLSKIDRFATLKRPFTIKVGSETITATGVSGLKLTGLTRGVGTSNATTHAKGVSVKFAGTPTRPVAPVAAEPFILADWQTDDLGRVLSDLATQTPLEWVESHAWASGKQALTHSLRVGYPSIGRRRDDLRLIVGENVTVDPRVSWTEYASEVLLLGAGEGRAMVRGRRFRSTDRLRRVSVQTASHIGKQASADSTAQARVDRLTGSTEVTELSVRGVSVALGDEVRVGGSGQGWAGSLDVWLRVIGITRKADTPDMTLTVRRVA